jgi:error-prone DNA polymerase
MPEITNPKLRIADEPTVKRVVPARLAYAELDVTSNFSFLRGGSHPDELVNRAAELGYRAIAVTDRHSLAGVVRMHEAAKAVGLKLIVGARLPLVDAPDLLVWATDRASYGRLCRLLTIGKRRAEKAGCILSLADLIEHNAGLLAAVIPPFPIGGETLPLRTLRDAFGDRLSLVASCVYGRDDQTHLRDLHELGLALRIPLLATSGVHYHDPSRRELQDLLTCIRHGTTIQQAGYRLFPNGERYLKSPQQMHGLFADHPQAIRRTVEIADRCAFSLDELRYEYPDEIVPEGMTPIGYLSQLAWQGAAERYPQGVPEKIRALVARELALIEQLRFEAYFLTVHDVVRFARSRGILCQGRGSAANSAVCYCIGVTAVDPARIDLLFERFVSAARNEPPDIDIDFEHERREEVLQYIYCKYGRERAGMTGVVITYRGKSAVRDVGKAMGLSLDMVDQMARRLEWWDRGSLNEQKIREVGLDPADLTVRQVVALTGQILGFPRHLSQHTGGMVMTRGPLCELVPIENAAMPDRTVIEWDKDDIDALGILKVDCLGLGMLTMISKAFTMLEGVRGEGTEGPRDKGTEGLRGEGERGPRERGGHGGESPDVSRLGRMAAGDGPGKDGLPSHQTNADGGTVRACGADVEGRVFDSVEYRRGVCATKPEGLPEVLADRPGIAGRTVDAVRTGDFAQDRPVDPDGAIAPRGGRPHPSVSDHELGEEDPSRRTSEENLARGHATLISIPHSLNPSVPQSLNPSTPQFLVLPHRYELHSIPPEDPAVYDMICDADTVGVFQIESRAQMSMLPRLRPRNFYDLVIEVAIVRPGPIQGNMVHPYLRRRRGQEQVSYPSEALRGVLQNTLGVPLFQEQAMRVVMVAAGFTAEQADQLRRAMAAWRRSASIDTFHEKIVNGMLGNGYTRDFAERTFEQIRGFGEYGFPESHAASFALLVYASAWIKRHHPAAFACALLNSQPMGFYAPAQIVRDAREHGVEVREVDVNCSEWDCTLEGRHGGTEARRHEGEGKNTWGHGGPAMRLGFRQVKGMNQEHGQRIVECRRRHGPFGSVEEFQQATKLPVATIRRLAEADTFGSVGDSRRPAVWNTLPLNDQETPLFDSSFIPPPSSFLPPMPLGQEVMTDYATLSLSLKTHPCTLVREELNRRKIITSGQINRHPQGRWVRVAGLVLVRQRPATASGVVFMTLEDETGIVNLIVRPDVYDRFRPAARHAGLMEAHGYVEREGQVVHVMVRKIIDLSHLLAGYQITSRDFH